MVATITELLKNQKNNLQNKTQKNEQKHRYLFADNAPILSILEEVFVSS